MFWVPLQCPTAGEQENAFVECNAFGNSRSDQLNTEKKRKWCDVTVTEVE